MIHKKYWNRTGMWRAAIDISCHGFYFSHINKATVPLSMAPSCSMFISYVTNIFRTFFLPFILTLSIPKILKLYKLRIRIAQFKISISWSLAITGTFWRMENNFHWITKRSYWCFRLLLIYMSLTFLFCTKVCFHRKMLDQYFLWSPFPSACKEESLTQF